MLVVDDNEPAREILCDLLRSLKASVTAVTDGAAAVDEIRHAASAGPPYSVAYVDWHMPTMDGLETAEAIRALGLQPPPKLVLMANVADDERQRAARNAGASAVLVKPVTLSFLRATTNDVLQGDISEEPGVETGADAFAGDRRARQGKRILVVEDDRLYRFATAYLLVQAGFDVDEAEDGEVALGLIKDSVRKRALGDRAAGYDLVLMDVRMPVLDGLAATRAIRHMPHCADLPVVALTANAEDRGECLAVGMNDFLEKPVEPKRLAEVVSRWTNSAVPGLPAVGAGN